MGIPCGLFGSAPGVIVVIDRTSRIMSSNWFTSSFCFLSIMAIFSLNFLGVPPPDDIFALLSAVGILTDGLAELGTARGGRQKLKIEKIGYE